LAWWKRRLRGSLAAPRDARQRGSLGAPRDARQRVTRSAGRAAFVELALPVRGGLSYELVLPSGACLRLPTDFDPERVARLVQALTSAGLGGCWAGAGRSADGATAPVGPC
jgi:hypothetical protein